MRRPLTIYAAVKPHLMLTKFRDVLAYIVSNISRLSVDVSTPLEVLIT